MQNIQARILGCFKIFYVSSFGFLQSKHKANKLFNYCGHNNGIMLPLASFFSNILCEFRYLHGSDPGRYRRSISSLYRVLRRIGAIRVKLPNPKLPSAKVYEQMTYPGQKVQIDVKIVPSICLTGNAKGKRFVQYTAIDEYSRMRYLEAFKEQSTLSSALFLKHLTERFKFKIECVQTDNGSEFTNRFIVSRDKPTLFEITAKKLGIVHKLIRPYTPIHNGKVERSHRKDNEYFYATHRFHSFEDFAKQLAVHNRKYNNFPMRPLGWKSPMEVLFSCSNL